MAEVWVARLRGKHGFEKLVAIKSILPQFATDINFQRMFLDEAHIASGIEHPSVAQILDLGEVHDVLYLVMEWVDGDALSKLHRACEKKQMKIPHGVLLRILADTCGGLHAAHELADKEGHQLGVVHRDVSPQNILVSTKGAAKLIDFGIAKARDRVGGETSSGMLKGKINYMAPEQALGKAVDRRADIWAIGSILYHLVIGRPPYEGANQLATLHLLASGRPPPPLPSTVPEAIADIIRLTLKHNPDNRIGTAGELQMALENAMKKAWIQTTSADVAAFVGEHLADRAENRRKAVDLALKAAAERTKMLQLLQAPSPDSMSGVQNTAGMLPPRVSSDLGSNPGQVGHGGPTARDNAAPSNDAFGAPAGSARSLPRGEAAATMPPLSETSAATSLGSSLLEPAADSHPPPPKRRRTAVIAIAAVATLVLVAGVSIGLTRGGGETPSRAAAKSTDRPTEKGAANTKTAASESATTVLSDPTTAPSSSVSDSPESVKSAAVPHPTIVVGGPWPKGTVAVPKPTASAKPKPKPVDDGF